MAADDTVRLNRWMEEEKGGEKGQSYRANCIQQRLLETTQRPTSAPWSIQRTEGRKEGGGSQMTLAQLPRNEWMKERMNETYSILGDSWLGRGTKTHRCVSVKDVMIMKCSGPFLAGLVHSSGAYLVPVPSPPLPSSAPGTADFGLIRMEPFHLDFDRGVITHRNVQIVPQISSWLQGANSATTNRVGVFCILVQNGFGCNICHLCNSFLKSHYMQTVWGGFRLPLCEL